MTPFSLRLDELLPEWGPWLLSLLTFAETCFFTGLVVPAGVATALGAFLAVEGAFPLWTVLAASALGAWAGDLTGFWLGRRYGHRLIEGRGYFATRARRYESRTARLFQRHPAFAVTGARLIAFVRTLMPWMAGMSPMPPVRYLAYDLPGVAGYVALYGALGYLAGESWRQVAQLWGGAGALLFLLLIPVLWFPRRRGRVGRRLAPDAEALSRSSPPESATIWVALTGGAGGGKTTVARLWAEAGVPVILTDDLARRVVEPGTEGLARVVEAFGRGVLRKDGALDRAALRSLVFPDREARRRLERLLHPMIQELRGVWMEGVSGRGAPLAVAEIPLLFEAGLEDDFDLVVVVEAPQEERVRRLVEERGLGEEEARAILSAQLPPELKREEADFVLDNGGTLEELEQRSLALLELLRNRAAGGVL